MEINNSEHANNQKDDSLGVNTKLQEILEIAKEIERLTRRENDNK